MNINPLNTRHPKPADVNEEMVGFQESERERERERDEVADHVKVHADAEEEGEARRELVDVEAGADAGAAVLDAVGDGEAQLQRCRGAGLLHVVARDADRVVLGHVLSVQEDLSVGQKESARPNRDAPWRCS